MNNNQNKSFVKENFVKDSKKVLIVDDSGLVRRIIRKELEGAGFEIEEAENGVKALVKVISFQPDLITLDMDMPHLDGLGTYRKLLEERYSNIFRNEKEQGLPVIFITANDTLEKRRDGFQLGAADFITKPFEPGEVLAAVNRSLYPETCLKGLSALVVDDSSTARKIVTKILVSQGVKVFEAADGLPAFEIMGRKKSEIDILITDYMMAEMHGDELCKKVRRELNLQDLPIIFLTGVTDQAALLDLFKAGGTDYIVKPFVKEELLARLNVHMERAQLNTRLKNSVEELRDLNKMKDNLLAICSHDLRSPLNGILGFAELMLENKDISEEDSDNINNILKSGELLLDLINDILALSKIQSEETELTLEAVSASSLVQSSFNSIRHMAVNKGQQIEFIDNFPEGVVLANQSAMIRVINNLLSNAVKFTPEKGQISLSVSAGPEDHLTITVADSGIGITEDKIPHLFDKFTKVSQSGTGGEEGTGLGLSIVKETIEKHDGRIDVTSKMGAGSRFNIILPLHKADTVTAATKKGEKLPEQGEASSIKACRILLADDNRMNRMLAKRILAKAGHSVTEVENGRVAVETAQKDQFDIILMDMQMPEMDGLEATKELRKSRLPDIPIIALTANTGEENVKACLSAGMNDFLSKPFKSEDIKDKILKWCPA